MGLVSSLINWLSKADTSTVIDYSKYVSEHPSVVEYETLPEVVGGSGYSGYSGIEKAKGKGVIIEYKTTTPSETGGSYTSATFSEVRATESGFSKTSGNVAYALSYVDLIGKVMLSFGLYINDSKAQAQGKDPYNDVINKLAPIWGMSEEEIRNSFLYAVMETNGQNICTYIPTEILDDCFRAVIEAGLGKNGMGVVYDNVPREEEYVTHGTIIPPSGTAGLIAQAVGAFNTANSTVFDEADLIEAMARLVALQPEANVAQCSYNADIAKGILISAGIVDTARYESFKWDNFGVLKGKIINTESWEDVTASGHAVFIDEYGGMHDNDHGVGNVREFGKRILENNMYTGNIATSVEPWTQPDYVQYIGDPIIEGVKLAAQYPDWYARQLFIDGIMADFDALARIGYIPLKTSFPIPDIIPSPDPKPDPQEDIQSGIIIDDDENPIPDPQPPIIDPITTDPIDPEPEPEPTPTPTPPPIVPIISTSASKLFTVHELTQQQVDDLGGYLWSSNFISQIQNMFTQPVDAIIGLHILHYSGNLPLGGVENIKLGSITAVNCRGTKVTNQYMKFSCGSITVPEHYGNVEDYEPYTKAQIFLPYIGFRDVSVNEIMGARVELEYSIDIFTGICVARLYATKNSNVKQEIYNFEGSCGIQQPVTGQNYSQIIGSILRTAIGAKMGSPLTMASGVSSLTHSKIEYLRSGNFTSNHGACAGQIPFILLERPIAYDANNYPHYYGNPSNMTVKVGDCSGYTRVKDIHTDGLFCTNEEASEIESLLRSGVLI